VILDLRLAIADVRTIDKSNFVCRYSPCNCKSAIANRQSAITPQTLGIVNNFTI
jgi:hypothetical protein